MNQTQFKDSIIQRPPVRLCTLQADSFPEGIHTVWNKLEARLKSIKGRKFYGLTKKDQSKLTYFAGVIPLNDTEIKRLSLPLLDIQGGKFARVKLQNWPDRISEISLI